MRIGSRGSESSEWASVGSLIRLVRVFLIANDPATLPSQSVFVNHNQDRLGLCYFFFNILNLCAQLQPIPSFHFSIVFSVAILAFVVRKNLQSIVESFPVICVWLQKIQHSKKICCNASNTDIHNIWNFWNFLFPNAVHWKVSFDEKKIREIGNSKGKIKVNIPFFFIDAKKSNWKKYVWAI